MSQSTNKAFSTVAGTALALLAGAPATADDTELLLIDPDPALNSKPNVLFILDTSGSMLTKETTSAPYNSATVYAGHCDTDSLYWTDVDVIPACDEDQERFIDKAAFQCDAATDQLTGIGSFTSTMVQYRDGGKDGDSPGPEQWQTLAADRDDDIVECQHDSGNHGDGRPNHLWARSGTDLNDPFTNDEEDEISWGSAPRNLSYTVYDGNYLNWRISAPQVELSRLDILKQVTKTVLGAIDNLNVGLMRFNTLEGGAVIFAMSDLDSNFPAIEASIDALRAGGRTPLSEALYESALYWRGEDAHYGELIDDNPTDPNALDTLEPENYKQPSWDVCAKNYNILLSDGNPVDDEDGEILAPMLPKFAMALGRPSCTFDVEGDCLDDIGEYLSVQDLDNDTDGDQTVVTHTIGFTVDLPILADTALDSGGKYFLADDVESLTQTLLSIISNINEKSLSFAAPAVAVNTFNQTRNLNDVYLTTFGAKPKVHWPGNLKKYRIDDRVLLDAAGVPAVNPQSGFFYPTARSFWTVGTDGNEVQLGGAAHKLPAPIARNLYTNNGDAELSAASNQITPANANAFNDADFGLTGGAGEPSKDELIRWARGEDTRDEDGDPATTVRNAMGDPLHSQPAAIVYGGDEENPDVVVYVATNDGYLHAIDGKTGVELWSFIPNEFLSNLTRLYFDSDSRFKQYGIDGNIVPVVRDIDGNGKIDGEDYVYILFGLRRGGSSYYALDVTDRNSPELKWTYSHPTMGQSWSTPVVTRMDIDVNGFNDDQAVVIIGGGYDTVHDTSAHPDDPDGAGNGVFFLDLESGAKLWRAGPGGGNELQLGDMTRSIATQIKVIDFSGDGLADRMYAADMGGQIWRFDIANGAKPDDLVAGGVVARLGAEGIGNPAADETRRFYNSPDISMFTDHTQGTRYIAISIGSGYRSHPFDLAATDRFYSIRDHDVFNQLTQQNYNNYDIATDDELVEVSGKKQVILQANDRGWKFTLPGNQKVLADSVTFNNEIFFVAFSPDNNAGMNCQAGTGQNFLYRVSVLNGDPIVNNLDALLADDADDARQQILRQGGIAPAPSIIFPNPAEDCEGPACNPPPVMCIGVECSEALLENIPVRTMWTQDGIQ